MRKVLAVVFVVALLAAVSYGVVLGLRSNPPDADEIYAALEDTLPEPTRWDDAQHTDALTIRGWVVWIGNYPKFDKRGDHEIDRRLDIGDQWRQVRIFRRSNSVGARVAGMWLLLTGNG